MQNRAILFRQMDGGEIWYENVAFNPQYKIVDNDRRMRRKEDNQIEYEMSVMNIDQVWGIELLFPTHIPF